MGLGHLSFLRDWRNPADFPTVEPDEATVRADLQYHPEAIKKYINETLIPSHDALTDAKHSHDNKTVLDGITADDVAKWRGTIGTFRINVTYSHSDGVYSADKTFGEIKAAYDAGQQPYVVEDALSGFYDIYTFSHFWYDESSTEGFADFECYRILTGTLKTITLRIHSRTLESGSNIEKQISEFNVPNGTTYIAVDSTNDVISTVNGETYADIQALIDADKPVVVRFDDGLDFYYFETFRFSDSSGVHMRLNFRCVMGSIVYTLTLRDDNTWVFRETSLQSKSITDSGGHFTSDTVEGALQEIGTELAGINTLLGSGIQISFTIDDETFSAVSGATWIEWLGGFSRVVSETSGLTLYTVADGPVVADEAGVYAVSLDGSFVYGRDTIISGATYTIINYGG